MPAVCRPRHCAGMSASLAAEVCVIGAGPVGGTLACRLAAAGVATVVVDRAALPPMEHPAFDGRAYAIAAGSRRLLEEAGVWDRLVEPAPADGAAPAQGTPAVIEVEPIDVYAHPHHLGPPFKGELCDDPALSARVLGRARTCSPQQAAEPRLAPRSDGLSVARTPSALHARMEAATCAVSRPGSRASRVLKFTEERQLGQFVNCRGSMALSCATLDMA